MAEDNQRSNTGSRNPNWRGGRSVASNGYILVRVGTDHHLADVRGYAYEHRVVAEKKLGRRLRPGEVVHHRNGIRSDNRPENLKVCESIAHHAVHHRMHDGRRLPGEPNETVQCACGCGAALMKYDAYNRPRKYVSGHNPQPSFRAAVLGYIRHVPEKSTPRFMAEFFAVEQRKITEVTSRLKRDGLIRKVSGEWKAVANV